ncbi:Hypothetical protein SRAE_X000167200 [Strongyloides ratti]|uniref:Uncharacterized protein n=1 Tax=Strongyloides ratti TaxID=34506 RepID=A0A090KRC3_STRRB|nr:Hypothetical protein SRAE_X000167200 [Strongyloides ratti]CEF59929.1 Hypothetical protein SRAE_X000167200 [Strongyloides ratti]
MLFSLLSVATLAISSSYGYMNDGTQQNVGEYVSPYDNDPTIQSHNLNFYNSYVQTHPYQPNFHHDHIEEPLHDDLYDHIDFHHFPGNFNFGHFGIHAPPPKSPYEFCFRPIYLPIVRSNHHFVNFCAKYARHINRAPQHPKTPIDMDVVEGSGMDGIL